MPVDYANAMRFLLALVLSSLLAGCAATAVPEAVREAPASTLTPTDVRAGPAPVGTYVRWGGTIAKIDNRKTSTWLEIVARPLDRNGKPRDEERNFGRFLAVFDGFLEPTEYATGRKVTVVGALQENQTGSVGEFPYVFPVVKATEHYLWPREPERVYAPAPSPFWYDPWYPWGWGYYPYRPYYYPWW